ncbi:hypothetical protein BQ8482_440019 [Mesorhizobium delmotii]|uniref:Uncharacterized protein n=1 Tax=Mesorhizobium delmotii TaxID=1631247 RepID=A0A2P9ATK0_9HYPH|nr:hypothetical protein BQ8482_440019 [Mesorhizobium delmotii]
MWGRHGDPRDMTVVFSAYRDPIAGTAPITSLANHRRRSQLRPDGRA